jgi:histidinol-phosphatase (PHP family)
LVLGRWLLVVGIRARPHNDVHTTAPGTDHRQPTTLPPGTPILASYHNHSSWSDGRASIAELVAAAQALHLDELGISDHFLVTLPGEDPPGWAMTPARARACLEELRSYADRTAPVVRVGLEVDWFADRRDAIAAAIEAAGPLDYVIGSVHEVDEFPIDASAGPWARLDAAARDDVHRRYWRAVRDLAASGLFDIVAHIDLAKKFGYLPEADLDEEIDEALDAASASGMVVEINTAGWHKPCADAYPSPEILQRCRKRDIPVTISADAHKPEHLVRDFRRAAERLANADYTEVARFRGREIILEPLESAVRGLPPEPDELEPDDF